MPLGTLKTIASPYEMGDEDDSQQSPAGEFFATLLHAATIAHQLHLQTRSFAQHKALDEFYKELPGLVDDVVESYQGKYGLVTDYPFEFDLDTKSPEKFLSDLSQFVTEERSRVAKDSEIQNDIDAIQSLINSTIYKIRFLK